MQISQGERRENKLDKGKRQQRRTTHREQRREPQHALEDYNNRTAATATVATTTIATSF